MCIGLYYIRVIRTRECDLIRGVLFTAGVDTRESFTINVCVLLYMNGENLHVHTQVNII